MNQFSVQPANFNQGLQGLNQGLQQRNDQQVAQQKMQAQQQIMGDYMGAIQSGDYTTAMDIKRQNPIMSQQLDQIQEGGDKDAANFKNAFSQFVLNNTLEEGIEKFDPHAAQFNMDLEGFRDMDDSERQTKLIMGLKADPRDAYLKMNEQRAAGRDKPQSAESIAFEKNIENMSEKDKTKARRINAGLDPRATGSAAQTIADKGTSELVGDSEAIISQRRKFGEMTGSSRAKAIDKGFDKVTSISKNIRNIDRAISAIDEGASTGVIESRFFPSFRKATVKLDQIQKELGLDIIGAVTFGALSQGELDLALETALPTGLEPEELKTFLTDKRAAQEKLKAYYESQVDFLDQGGTIAGFLRSQKRGGDNAGDAGGTTVEVDY